MRARIITVRNYHSPLPTRAARAAPAANVDRSWMVRSRSPPFRVTPLSPSSSPFEPPAPLSLAHSEPRAVCQHVISHFPGAPPAPLLSSLSANLA